MPSRETVYVVERDDLSPGGKPWRDLGTVAYDPVSARRRATEHRGCRSPAWVKKNPLRRVVKCELVEVDQAG